MTLSYDLRLDWVKAEILSRGFSKVLIQLPEGMLGEPVDKISKVLSSIKGLTHFFSGDPCFGACDLALDAMTHLRCDGLVHFGHSPFSRLSHIESDKVIFVEASVENQLEKVLPKAMELVTDLNWKNIGVLTTVQHKTQTQDIIASIRAIGGTPHIVSDGTILGCDVNNAKKIRGDVDGYICLAGGMFHSRGVVINTGKPCIRVDPYTNEVELLGESYFNKYLKKRYAMILKAQTAKYWGILLSIKPGQLREDQALHAEKLLQKAGRRVLKIVGGTLDPFFLSNFIIVKAWISTACPRISLDDPERFTNRIPILSLEEMRVALKDLSWEDFLTEKIG